MKTTKRFVAFLLCALLLIPLPMVQGETSFAIDKIEEELLTRIYAGDILLPVLVRGSVPKEKHSLFYPEGQMAERASAEFVAVVEERQKELGIDSFEPALSVLDLYHATPYFGMSSPDPLSITCVLAAVWLPESEIWRLGEMESVSSLMLVDKAREIPISERSFHAGYALRSLQCSVGLLEPKQAEQCLYSWETNPNKDDKVDAADALLSLQESVGLVAIAYPYFWMHHHSGMMTLPAIHGYDWEIERFTPWEFLFANDLNGDGKADIIDLYLKYQDRLCAPLV